MKPQKEHMALQEVVDFYVVYPDTIRGHLKPASKSRPYLYATSAVWACIPPYLHTKDFELLRLHEAAKRAGVPKSTLHEWSIALDGEKEPVLSTIRLPTKLESHRYVSIEMDAMRLLPTYLRTAAISLFVDLLPEPIGEELAGAVNDKRVPAIASSNPDPLLSARDVRRFLRQRLYVQS